MAILSTGNTFGATDTVTNTKLNNIADAATFDDPVDNSTLELHTDGKLRIKDAGVTASKLATDALELAYPVGSIYMNASDATNPATLLGFGTWVAFGAGRVPVGIDATDDDFDVVGSGTNTNGTTGAKTHTLGKTEIPPHKHQISNMNARNIYDRDQGGGGYDPNTAGTIDTGQGDIGENGDGTGSASPHNNLQPYIVVHMWTRTA
jgi:hypothetical protein